MRESVEQRCMRQDREAAPKVIPATRSPSAEHRKAGHSGDVAFGWATAFLLASGLSALAGFYGVALALAGIFVALVVVGVMFQHEGERQQQRADPSRSRRGFRS
jgi:hypothetical protein